MDHGPVIQCRSDGAAGGSEPHFATADLVGTFLVEISKDGIVTFQCFGGSVSRRDPPDGSGVATKGRRLYSHHCPYLPGGRLRERKHLPGGNDSLLSERGWIIQAILHCVQRW